MSDISKRLHRLATMDPLEDINSAPDRIKIQPKKEKVEKEETFNDVLAGIDKGINRIASAHDFGESFDDFIDLLSDSDEDLTLKNSLMTMGKKYNREHMIEDDDTRNAIDKAFEPYERELKDLKTGVMSDIKEIDDMIFKMKSTRGTSTKMMADLMESRNSARNTMLSAINKSVDIQKAKFDIANKQKKTEDMGNDAVSSANLAVQQLLQQSSSGILDSVGGREGSSGAFFDDEDPYDALLSDPGYNLADIAADREEPEYDEEGDLFIKYENDFDHLELGIRDDGSYSGIRAIDKDGHVLPEYPVPDKIHELRFKIDSETRIASDQMNRRYQVRYVDQEDPDSIF